MNQKRQLEVTRRMHEKEIDILKSKAHDYAGEGDVLSNFKEVSEICRILNIDSRTDFGTHMFYVILKIQRLCNLMTNGKEAKNESVQDTIVDLRNYVGLLNCSIEEEEEEEVYTPGTNAQTFSIRVPENWGTSFELIEPDKYVVTATGGPYYSSYAQINEEEIG